MCDALVIQQIATDLAVIKSHVIGNGAPGLVKRVAVVEDTAAKLAATVDLVKWGIPVAATISGIVIGAVVKLVP